MNDEVLALLKRQGYKVVGTHSGVKLCHWMRQKLLYGRSCYKEQFYGIESHRCLQMTPTVDQCNLNCLFCWRAQNFSGYNIDKPDDPEFILENCIKAQKNLTTGFKGDDRCDLKLWNEAQKPNQVAISLTGEPTFYPRLAEFIELCHKKGMTTFVVSNGTTPKIIEKLDPLPTQLYITVAAPNEEIYKKLCAPMFPRAWQLLMETLELLPSLATRTTIRITLVDGWNLGWEEDYAKIINGARPNFIEPKGFVFVGPSRWRMKLENMPSHEKVKNFGLKLTRLTDYEILHEVEDSRVVLLSDGKMERLIKNTHSDSKEV